MGLAASQARLLTITARLSDNELRSQTINNAKMRLATQSSQASDEYVSALNNAQLMYSSVGTDGLAKKQALTFNALTEYSQYNNQYGIVNSAGKILVSEEDAAIFEKTSHSLENFLQAHGLEWETTFFSDDSGKLSQKLTSFYNGSNAYIGNMFKNKSNEDLKEMYLASLSQNASIEKLNYETIARKYYEELTKLYDNTIPEFRDDLFGDADSGIDEEIVAKKIATSFSNASSIINELKTGYHNPGGSKKTNGTIGVGPTAAYAYNNISKYLSASGQDNISYYLTTLKEDYGPNGNKITGVQKNGNYGITEIKKEDGSTVYQCSNISITVDKDATTATIVLAKSEGTKNWYYNNTACTSEDNKFMVNVSPAGLSGDDLKKFVMTEMTKIKEEKNEDDGTTYFKSWQVDTNDSNKLITFDGYQEDHRNEVYEAFIITYFDQLMNVKGFFDPGAYAENHPDIQATAGFMTAKDEFLTQYGLTNISANPQCLIDFDKLVKSGIYNPHNSGFDSVLNTWLVDKMLDVLGEPKYDWVDKKDPSNTGNATSKAQWLTNLFNRMQNGYKVLENGLAKSQDWLEYAFESGLVSMEQVDLSFNWVSMDYKACSNIYEETDNSAAVSKAEAKYTRAMNDIKQKDSMYDLELKNIDTEHSALQTEYDTVKNVMNKNIERTMKFNQSA